MTVAIAKEGTVLDYPLNKIIKSISIENLQNLKNMSKHSPTPIPNGHGHQFGNSVLEDSKTCSEPKYESTKVWNSVLYYKAFKCTVLFSYIIY